jgi:hypothetical protein
MDKNNKINKLNKIVINNKDLLNSKYKERNDLLENDFINKDIKLDDLNKLDKYIESIELENKKIEKELEELKKKYDSNISIKKDKTQLCKYYTSDKGCDKGSGCSFAHGEDDLNQIIKSCFSGLKCYKKDCKYYHPEGWNYKNNIKIREFFKNGYCINEDNCNFKHINNENIEITDGKINNDIKLYENNEFQEKIKTNNYGYIREIVNNHLHEDIIYDIIENNKKKNNNDIDNNLSLNFTITVDGVEHKDLENIFNNNNEINNQDINYISDNTIELINSLQNKIDKYIKNIKKEIDQTFLNDNKKYGINMKLELNQINSLMILFKENYKDININNKDTLKYNNI